jgi:hypothetical protein
MLLLWWLAFQTKNLLENSEPHAGPASESSKAIHCLIPYFQSKSLQKYETGIALLFF